MRFRKDLACFLVMILTISVVLWLGENVLAEGVSANTMSVSENTLMTEEVKENNIVSFAADDIANGTDGNITWAIDVDGKLVVNGSGDFLGGIPWGAYSSSITSAVVEITGMTDASYMFSRCEYLEELDLSNFDTSSITDMKMMFNDCSNLSNLDLSNFSTSNVLNMAHMFYGCSGLSNLDLSNFNTSNVISMQAMFTSCSGLISLDLSNFDTSSVTDMSSMFGGCENLKSLNLSNFDTSSVTDMSSMFGGCGNLKSLNLSNFDTSSVTDMGYMFNACGNLKSLNLSNFDTLNVTFMDGMFFSCNSLNELDLSSFDMSHVSGRKQLFYGCNNLFIIYTPYNISMLDSFSLPLENESIWYLPDGTKITELPKELTYSITIIRSQNDNIAGGIDGGITWIIDKNGKLTVSGTGNILSSMIPWLTYSDKIISAEISVTEMTDASHLFDGCKNLIDVNLSNFDTSNLFTTRNMFNGCSSLINLDLSNLDTSNISDMAVMFGDCSSLINLNLSNFQTSWVTYMNGMFEGCSSLINIDLSSFDTKNVRYMNGMFKDCKSLKNLDLSNFNTNKVIGMQNVFSGCSSLTDLDLNNFSTEKTEDMGGMFENCSSLEKIDLSSFNTSNVTNMWTMFEGCRNLVSLDLSKFDTSNVTDMWRMFTNCNDLQSLDLSSFDMANVTRVDDMLLGCNNLTMIDTPHNLILSVKLPFVDGEIWKTSDATELSELPKNANNSIIIKREKKIPMVNGSDNWFLVIGAANCQDIYIAKNNDQTVLDTLFDKLYNNAYQTLFIDDSNTDLKKLVPVFENRNDVKVYVNGFEQISGESEQNFLQGYITYNASNSKESRNYQVRFVKKESGPKLFVNGPSNREVYLTDYFNNTHDILIANIGDETLTGIKVELLNATHVKLDDAATTGLGNNNILSAFTKIPSSGESASVMTNLGKIRLVPDGEGEIQGTLVISADGQAPIYIELSGYSSNPKITTTTTDLNMEDVVRVKYVPYSYTVETNNIDTENTITFSLEEGHLAEGLQIYPATGEIYGVPLETGEFPIKVKATYSRPEYLPSYADITLTVKDNTDGNVYNASDSGYELIRPVGKATSSGSNDFVLTRKGNQLFVSAGPYHEFVDFWLNGQRLIEGEDYTKESGSTRITVRAQTFINKTDAKGTNTFAAEFRTAGDSCDNLRRTAQNFRINFKKGSSSKSRSDSDERTVTTMAAVSSKVSFAMRMVNPSGLPLSGLTIEVHSTPKVSQTNQNGMAAFYDVESGTHTLFVKDKDGNILASTDFEILFGDATKLQNMQLTVKSGSRFTLDAQLDENVLTFVKLQEGDVHQILSVNTGDNSDYILWIFMMFISTSLGIGIYQNRKQSKIER